MVTSVVTPETARSDVSGSQAPKETEPPVPRRRWACAFPMTGVRYYRFLPEVPDSANVPGPRETIEPDRSAASQKRPGGAVRGVA